jgi:galactofuranose transport system substrate-binding protein
MSLPVLPARTGRARAVLLAASLCAVAVAGCANPESQTAAPAGSGPAAAAAPTQAQSSSGGASCNISTTGYPKVDLANAVVGFSQSEKEGNPFRIAETQSIRDEAAKLGIPTDKLLVTNAQSDLNKQISDIKSMLAQGAQLLVVAPLNSDGLQPALDAAKEKKVPVVTIDRKVNSKPCTDYLTFIGSDFVAQGKRAADQMIQATGGNGKVAILLGSSGNNVTTDRTKGFKDELATAPGLSVVAEQTGEFERAKGQSVMEQLIQSNPDITAVYAENDEMGIGAVNALKAAGKQPGTDVKVISIDGTRNAVQLIVDGSYNGVVESNPRFGPLAFDTLKKFEAGEDIANSIIITDDQYDSSNAAQKVGNAY